MARCEYRHPTNSQVIVAKIVVGTRAEAMLRTLEATRRAQSDPQLVQSHHFDGFDATLYRDTVTAGQWVLTSRLPAADEAVFSISFKDVPPEYGLKIAGQFDWKAMAAGVRVLTLPTLQVPRYEWGPNEWGSNP